MNPTPQKPSDLLSAPISKPYAAAPTAREGETRTYRNALSPKAHRGFNLEYVDPEMEGNIPVFDFSPEDVVEGSQRWRTAAVGFVMGHKAQFGMMQRYVDSRWSEFGKVELFRIDSGWFVFRFETEEVRDKVLEMGPWTYAKRPLLLKPWTPEVVMDEKSLEVLPVWVRLPSIKLCFWTPSSLSRIASIIGKPVCIDGLTASQDKLSFARLCIEITAKSELPEMIYFRDKEGQITQQQVMYEWLPLVCEKCANLGHKASQCVKQSMQFIAKSSEGQKKGDTGVEVLEQVTGMVSDTRAISCPLEAKGSKRSGQCSHAVNELDVMANIAGCEETSTGECGEQSDPRASQENAKEQRLDKVALPEQLCNSEVPMSPNGLEVCKIIYSDVENSLSSIVASEVDTRGSSVDFVKSSEKVEGTYLDSSKNRAKSNSVDRAKHCDNLFAILSDLYETTDPSANSVAQLETLSKNEDLKGILINQLNQDECEGEFNQTPYPTRGRGRPRGTTKEKTTKLLGSPGRNTRGRKKQVSQNLGNFDSNKKLEETNLNDNNEVSEVVTKDDPDVIAVSKLTYEFVVAVSKRKRKNPWSREEFKKELERLKEAGAEMVKIY